MKENRLNDLSGKEWIKFQKSWFIHNPPPREKSVLRHPAKFPETLVGEFIEFYTKRGMSVLDPMVGTGSTLVACIRSGRAGYGIELNPVYADIARLEVGTELDRLGRDTLQPEVRVFTADARDAKTLGLPVIDYCITSPPYWDMLRAKGAETQRKRRTDEKLDINYSDHPQDLGNIADYELFLEKLVGIYREVCDLLRPGAYMTVIVKNIKKKGRIYPLAWDLGRELGKFLELKDEKIWCQDNQPLFPYAMGYSWVSNTFHHYCLNFRKTIQRVVLDRD